MTDSVLAVGVWNTHASAALRQGGLGWLLNRAPRVRLWLLQEVRAHDHIEAALREERALGDWRIVPGPHYEAGDAGLPYVLAWADRFELLDHEHPDITFGSRYTRKALGVLLHDRRTDRDVYAESVHVDPLGRGFTHANPVARRRHERQVQAYADQAADTPDDTLALAGGDFNEALTVDVRGELSDRTAVARMAGAGLRPAHRLTSSGDRGAHLDDLFVRPDRFVKVTHRRRLTPPQEGNDHPAVITRLRVRPRR